jgi:DNA ligase-1
MKLFSRLILDLEEAREPVRREGLLDGYFRVVSAEDAEWAMKLLSGKLFKKLVGSATMMEAGLTASGLPQWLFHESLKAVGDVCEAVALVLAEPEIESGLTLSECVLQRIMPLAGLQSCRQADFLVACWGTMSRAERLVYNKLVTGKLRSAVSVQEVSTLLANISGLSVSTINFRLATDWVPNGSFFLSLIAPDQSDAEHALPYEFCSAAPVAADLSVVEGGLGWLAEGLSDGLRAQVVRRRGKCYVWLRSGALVTDSFPEIAKACRGIPDGTVLDGEIVAWMEDGLRPVSAVTKRLDRKPRTVIPAGEPEMRFLAFDILENAGCDVRLVPFAERRRMLEEILSGHISIGLTNSEETREPALLTRGLALSSALSVSDRTSITTLLDQARELGMRGLILKKVDSPYVSDEDQRSWFALKSEPLSVHGVLMYVERDSGGISPGFLFTLGVWKDEDLIPIAKVGREFSTEQSSMIEAFVKENTLEKFGPVRTVRAAIVMELRFDGVEVSARRKAGIALRSPRIHRMCVGMRPEEAGRLSTILELLSSPLSKA